MGSRVYGRVILVWYLTFGRGVFGQSGWVGLGCGCGFWGRESLAGERLCWLGFGLPIYLHFVCWGLLGRDADIGRVVGGW